MKCIFSISAVSLLALTSACDRDEETVQQRAEERSEFASEQTGGQPGTIPEERQPVAGEAEEELGVDQPRATDEEQRIQVELEAAEGVEMDGEAEFSESEQGVKVVLKLENATPGKHGVHIHEKADCSNIKGKSMGGHFAPQGDKHALPGEKPQAERHLGDLGNIDVDKDGSGKLEFTISRANLKEGDKMSFRGKALVVHEGKDVGSSKQPSGSSGAPIACAVIE